MPSTNEMTSETAGDLRNIPIDKNLEVRLFNKYSQMLSVPALAKKGLIVVTGDEQAFRSAIILANAAGSDVMVTPYLHAVRRALEDDPRSWRCLMIDLDGEDVDDAVDVLVDLRKKKPDLLIILASREFRHSDCSKDRLAIGDASLRIPFSYDCVDKALNTANENNRIWVGYHASPDSVEVCGVHADPMSIPMCDTLSKTSLRNKNTGVTEVSGSVVFHDGHTTPKRTCDDELVSEESRWAAGWWILPSMALGVLAWIAIFWSLLRAFT